MNHVIRNTQSHVKFLVCLSSLVVEVYLFWLFHILEFLHHFGMEYLLAGLIASNLPKKSSSSVPAGSQTKATQKELLFCYSWNEDRRGGKHHHPTVKNCLSKLKHTLKRECQRYNGQLILLQLKSEFLKRNIV